MTPVLLQAFVTSTARLIDTAVVLSQGKGALAVLSPGMLMPVFEHLSKYMVFADVKIQDLTADTRCTLPA